MRLTNPYEWHESDLLRGLRDFRRGRDTAHRDAFEVFLCAVGHDILGIKALIEDYLEAMTETNKSRK